MKTNCRYPATIMNLLRSHLLRLTLTALLLVAGSTANEAWAADIDHKGTYYVINLDGQLCLEQYDGGGSNNHNNIGRDFQSPFVATYRVYSNATYNAGTDKWEVSESDFIDSNASINSLDMTKGSHERTGNNKYYLTYTVKDQSQWPIDLTEYCNLYLNKGFIEVEGNVAGSTLHYVNNNFWTTEQRDAGVDADKAKFKIVSWASGGSFDPYQLKIVPKNAESLVVGYHNNNGELAHRATGGNFTIEAPADCRYKTFAIVDHTSSNGGSYTSDHYYTLLVSDPGHVHFGTDLGTQQRRFHSLWINNTVTNKVIIDFSGNENGHNNRSEQCVILEQKFKSVITYHIVNSAGETMESMIKSYTALGQTLSLTATERMNLSRVGCTLSTKFYSDPACQNEITTLTTGTTDVYIPYTFNTTDAEKTELSRTGMEFSTAENPVWFNFWLNGNRFFTYSTANDYLQTSNENNALRVSEADSLNVYAQFAFIGDPYCFKMLNRGSNRYAYRDGAATNGTIRFAQNPADNLSQWAMFPAYNDNSRFRIIQNGEWNRSGDLSYWNPSGGSSPVKLWTTGANKTDNNAKVSLPPAYTHTMHIVNKQNTLVLSKRIKVPSDPTTTLWSVMPGLIKSPLIPNDANHYKFFNSQAEAYAYTTAGTTTGAITTKAEVTGTDIYVGYQYDPAQAPSGSIDLSGDRWYKIYYKKSESEQIYAHRYLNNDAWLRWENNSVSAPENDNYAKVGYFLWKFTGDDPYGFQLTNMQENKVIGANSSTVWNVNLGFNNTHQRFYLRKDSNGKWNIGITGVQEGCDIGAWHYIRWFGTDNTGASGKELQVQANDNSAANVYVTNRAYCALNIEPILRTYTYHIIDNNGREALRATVTDVTVGDAAVDHLPDLLKSPAVSSYTFYKTWAGEGNQPTDAITSLLSSTDVYVRYTANPSFAIDLTATKGFYNVTLNGQYAYADGDDAKTTATLADNYAPAYLWQLDGGGDPYALWLKVSSADTKRLGATDLTTGTATQLYASDNVNVRRFALLNGDGTTGHYTLAAASGATITDGNFAYLGRNSSTTQLFAGSTVTQTTADVQVTFATVKTSYTYHIIDLAGNEAVQYTAYNVFDPTIELPSAIRSDYVTEFSYYSDAACTVPLASLSATDVDGNVYVKYEAASISLPDGLLLDGSAQYLLKTGGSHYTYANNSSFSTQTDNANLDNANRQWKLMAANGDPYAVTVQSAADATKFVAAAGTTTGDLSLSATGSPFILMPHPSISGSYQLMLASGTTITDNQLAYLGETSNTAKLVAGDTDATEANRQVAFEMPPFTYIIVDLSGKFALKSQTIYANAGSTAQLPEFMQSPLVETYHYWSAYDSGTGEVSSPLPGNRLVGGDVYVTYTPYALADAPLMLDGSQQYTVFNKDKGIDGIFGPNQVKNNTTDIPYTDETLNHRPKHFPLQLTGTHVGSYYDPYDVVAYFPGQERIWSATIMNAGNQGTQQVSVYEDNGQKFFMILNGATGFVELMFRKRNGNTYYDDRIASYQYVYFDGSKLNTGQHATNYVHGMDKMQIRIQRPYIYHVLTLEGKEAINAIGTLMDISPDGTTNTAPQLPSIIKSPLVTTYRYYDITAFKVSNGIYTLKSGATSLEHLSDATTGDIFVVYDKTAINDDIDLTGQKAYNIQVNPADNRYIYYQSGKDSDFQTDDATTSITNDNYLWQFYGGDPYALKLLNVSMPGKYASNEDWESSYRGPIGFNTSREINTYMLVQGYGADGFTWRLMGSPAGEANRQQISYRYQYIGGNARYWGTNHDVAWVNAGDHNSYNYNTSNYIQLKLTRQNEAKYQYVVVNSNGDALVKYTVDGTEGATPTIPDAIKSPYATNFTYHDAATGGSTVTKTSENATIYVRYAYDPNSTLDIGQNGTQYNMVVNGQYVHATSATAVEGVSAPADRSATDYTWVITGDPYQAHFESQAHTGSHLAYDNSNNLSLSATASPFIILGGADGKHVELMAARGQEANTDNTVVTGGTYANLGYSGTLKLYTNSEAAHYAAAIATELKRLPVPVTWHILDIQRRQAVAYTEYYDDYPTLEFASIPALIRSPYLEGETLTFYTDATPTGNQAADGRSIYSVSSSDAITAIPGSGVTNLWVTYTATPSLLMLKPLHLRGLRGFSMRINGRYLYDNAAGELRISTTEELSDRLHLWSFSGHDPYAVQVHNVGDGQYIIHDTSGPSFSLNTDATNNSYFIVMDNAGDVGTIDQPIVELMAAKGDDIALNPHYSIGRTNGFADEPTLFSSTNHGHNDQQIRIQLKTGLVNVAYQIVDKQDRIVVADIPNESNGACVLPDEWQSPMVSQYHYWTTANRNEQDGDTYTFTGTEATSINDAADGLIYVTYDVKAKNATGAVDMNTTVDYTYRESRSESDATQVRDADAWGTMYRLQYTSSADYRLEDGSDSEDTNVTASGTHLFPYTNGDGPMYIYQESRWEAQKDGAASTRTRWTWYLLSPTNDPYHVMVTSWQNTHAYKHDGTNNRNYYSFFRTYYNDELSAVITGNVTDDDRHYDNTEGYEQLRPTEYMLLKGNGTTGQYRLRTTELLQGEHQTVNSFEQYWRNNPTVQRKLGMAVGSSEPTTSQKNTLKPTWHNYQAYVNAAPWTGGSKSYAKDEHWFMTVSMGDGSFDLLPTDMNAALILLDNHGWEIMRHAIYKKSSQTTQYNASKQELKKYDSPMVAEYRYFINGAKVPGYHKYDLTGSTVSQVATTTTLGADYPQSYQGGMIRDLYVTYTVKPQYADAYSYDTETKTQSPTAYLVQQGAYYAKANGNNIDTEAKGIVTIDNVSDETLLWYLQRNQDIDKEMGYRYTGEADVPISNTPMTQAEMEASYTEAQQGFDPYNLQLKNMSTGGLFHVNNISGTTTTGGQIESTYSGDKTVSLATNPATVSGTFYDNPTLRITGSTFMAIDDGNGNIRLMPRFDHAHVQTDFVSLANQDSPAVANDEAAARQTTIFRLPNAYTYIILDLSGREALRFTSASGDIYPKMKSQFQSPFATNFTFYKAATLSGDTYTVNDDDKIETLGSVDLNNKTVYVTYDYDPTKDVQSLLEGAWFTMKVNGTDVQYDGTNVKTAASTYRWRTRTTAGNTTPDPYALSLYGTGSTLASIDTENRFALLPWNTTDGAYALAQTGTQSTASYPLVNGSAIATAATLTQEANIANGGTLIDDVKVQFTPIAPTKVTYKLVSSHSSTVVLEDVVTPTAPYTADMPAWMKTPLMTADAYHYYTAATESSGKFTVTPGTETHSTYALDNLDDGVLYVRYDYTKSKTGTKYNVPGNGASQNADGSNVTLELNGQVPYSVGNKSEKWKAYVDNKVLLKVSDRNINYYYTTSNLWMLSNNDPYEIAISPYNDKSKFMKVPNVETLQDEKARNVEFTDEGTHNTFMLLKSPNSNYLTFYVTGNQRVMLREQTGWNGSGDWDNKYLVVFKDDQDYSSRFGKNEYNDYHRAWFYPAVAYHVMTNDGVEALSSGSLYLVNEKTNTQTTVELPKPLQSPLLNSSDFKYYLTKTGSGSSTTYSDEIEAGTTLRQTALDGICDVYVRYTYDREKSPLQYPDGFDKTDKRGLDLSGKTWYTMAYATETSDNGTYRDALYYDSSHGTVLKTLIQNDEQHYGKPNNGLTLSNKAMLWSLEGDDPYAIRIRNGYEGTTKYLSSNDKGTIVFTNDNTSAEYSTYMFLTARGHGERASGGNLFIPTGFLDDNHYLSRGNQIYNSNSSGDRARFTNFNSGQKNVANHLGTINPGEDTTGSGWVSFYKAPIGRRYHYYAVKYEGTENKGITWDAVLEHDWLAPLEMEDMIARLFTKYETPSSTFSGTGDVNVTGTNTFVTRDQLTNDRAQFYADAALTERVKYLNADDNTITFDIYPDFDEDDQQYADGYPIYFKYQAMTNAEIRGTYSEEDFKQQVLPFQWSTKAQIDADVATREQDGILTKENKQANWYFMVLDTDEGVTRTVNATTGAKSYVGNQYFLRREDDGSVGWLRGVRTLHKETEDNLPGNTNTFTYNRLAESTRDSDHEPFREPRWLWAFMGDPYDMHVVNFESATGVTFPDYGDTSNLDKADNCYTRYNHIAETDDNGNETVTLPIAIPTTEPSASDKAYFQWGLAKGYADENTMSLLNTNETQEVDERDVNQLLYWQMATTTNKQGTVTGGSVTLQTEPALRQRAIQLLPYEPTVFEDVNLIIRRDDEVAQYKSDYPTSIKAEPATLNDQLNYLNGDKVNGVVKMTTGINRMFYAAEDRMFVAGDKITQASIPVEVKRQFCNYDTFSDDYRNPGYATVLTGPYRNEFQGYNDSNEEVYNYKYPNGTVVSLPQSFYLKYEVTSNIFLKDEPADDSEVARMAQENDHVYFMDFTDNLAQEGYNLGHHSYYDPNGSMRDQTPAGINEKYVWDPSATTTYTYKDANGDDVIQKRYDGAYVEATGYNDWQYKTTENRMTTIPERLKWYFVGDPYHCQVFTTAAPGKNLARFNEEESAFQFIADCVHLRESDDNGAKDTRELIARYRPGVGSKEERFIDAVHNYNYNKPIHGKFYWEVVPTVSDREDAFALRFRSDNFAQNYSKVYYYLMHDGEEASRTYYNVVTGEEQKFSVNLSYDPHNTYASEADGIHKANDKRCVVHLMQPAKVYVTAYPKGETTPKVVDELSEYFGIGEQLRDIPRHLKRKYTDYSNLRYIPKGTTLSNIADYSGAGQQPSSGNAFPLTLSTDVAYDYGVCDENGTNKHPVGNTTTPVYNKVFVSGAKTNADYRLLVDYELDETGKAYFTTAANANNSKYTWLDLRVTDWQGGRNEAGGSNTVTWMYYDKFNTTDDPDRWKVTSFTDTDMSTGSSNGWNTGVKGLHWAFVGDAYSFKMVNRRQLDSSLGNPYLGTSNEHSENFQYISNMSEAGNFSYPVTGQRIYDREDANTPGYKATPYDAYLRLQSSDTPGATFTDGNGNTDWGLVYTKTGDMFSDGDQRFLLRTASLKTTMGDYANQFTKNDPWRADNLYTGTLNPGDAAADAYNHTNAFSYVEWQRGHYKEAALTGGNMSVNPENSSDITVADFLLAPFSLETPTAYLDLVLPATAKLPDGDPGLNDCFDANVEIVNANTGERMAYKNDVEMRYTDAAIPFSVIDAMPQTLKRYGCSYTAYLNYGQSDQTALTGDKLYAFTDEELARATKKKRLTGSGHYTTNLSDDNYPLITYVYTVEDSVSQFFTTADDALNDEYVWSAGYYKWMRTITGRVQYTYTETYIKDYVYNEAGRVVGYIYGEREVTKWTDGTSTDVTTTGWLNTHNGSNQAFANDHQQNDEDNDQKWAYIGDPYSFQMKNYTKYLDDEANAYADNGNRGMSFSITGGSNFALVLDSDGKYYLALVDVSGNVVQYITFNRGDNTDLDASLQYLYKNGELPTDDPTSNVMGLTPAVKPFYITSLNSYAAYVIYHLVIAHQHAADYEDTFTDNAPPRKVRKRLAEWLKYHGDDALVSKYVDTGKYAFDYRDYRSEGPGHKAKDGTTDINGYYITDDIKTTYWTNASDEGSRLNTEATDELSTILREHSASLRDVVSFPIENYSVEKVPIGNTLNVPWYMKRQFCNYTLYQRDVLRSDHSDSSAGQATDANGVPLWRKTGTDGEEVVVASSTSPGAEYSPVYNVTWKSVTQKNDAEYHDDVVAANGKVISTLNKSHLNRMVLVDVVYDVDTDEFSFSDKGRNTTKWYSMMTNNAQDGLMNFSYKDGIGARPDRTVHYTNNYLWAPVGDPYGFVLHNRYATLNGSGWDNVVVSTTGLLPTFESVKQELLRENQMIKVTFGPPDGTYDDDRETTVSGDLATDIAIYTGQKAQVSFNERRIVHPGRGEEVNGQQRRSWSATNAVYEMYTGQFRNSFLMHPTSAYVNTNGDRFGSFYMVHEPLSATTQLKYVENVKTLRGDEDANWRLITTPEQLLPYFDRSGYVGGLEPTVANRSSFRRYYARLQEFKSEWANNSRDLSLLPTDYFKVTDEIRTLVYGGKFYARQSDGSYETSEFTFDTPRPKGAESYKLPLKFVPDNLVPMQQGYYRLVAFSQAALDNDAENVDGIGGTGIQGPRYISGYRFLSEKEKSGYNSSGTLQDGSRWLHFYETDEAHTTFNTFGELNSVITTLDAHNDHERDIAPHPALRGRIEILPAEYDPSTIFYFQPAASDGFDRYTWNTQGLRVRGRSGGVQQTANVTSTTDSKYGSGIPVSADSYGVTKLVEPGAAAETGFDDRFRLQDIGGTAVTLRLLKTEPNGTNWDDIVGENLKHGSLCIDANHRYRVTIHDNNEMMEIGDIYTAEHGWSGNGIQDTKWLLQPVGVKQQWPYNEVPLRVEVHKGDTKSGTDNYYASLYVPFDTRLQNPTDLAFTLDTKPGSSAEKVTLRSLSLLNNMGNPQFIPASWPVIIRSTAPGTGQTKPSTHGLGGAIERRYVNLYLPTNQPTEISESKTKINNTGLKGSYLERSLTDETTLTGAELPYQTTVTLDDANSTQHTVSSTVDVMVFGQPFKETGGVNTTTVGAATYYEHDDTQAPGFYTNENWWRGHYGTSQVNETENDGSLARAFLASLHGIQTATKQQRSNTYVYHNRVFLLYEVDTTTGPRYLPTRFDDDSDYEEDHPIDEDLNGSSDVPWPCDVYDLAGRRVAENETPATLLRNYPSLRPGVYIFGHQKVVVHKR